MDPHGTMESIPAHRFSGRSRSRRKTTIGYLNARQHYGTNTAFIDGSGPRQRVQASRMASIVAWNPRRMHNMSLAIGPGTPATVIMAVQPSAHGRSDEDDSSSGTHLPWDEEDQSDESDDTDEDEMQGRAMRMVDSSDDDDDDDDDEPQEDEEAQTHATPTRPEDHSREPVTSATPRSQSPPQHPESPRSRFLRSNDATLRRESFRIMRQRLREDALADHAHQSQPPQRSHSPTLMSPMAEVRQSLRARNLTPSLRHDGCINTADWLHVPWRFSTVNEAMGVLRTTAVSSHECPTQIVTSGDDRLVKVWDCAGAMGMDQPLAGGWNTFCPYCMLPPKSDEAFAQEWREYYGERAKYRLGVPGTTRNLCTVPSGHRGNVFHVTPLKYDAGKVLTCAADGYLRLIDCGVGRSSVVYGPQSLEEETPFVIHSVMAYSHVMLTPNTGMICSERGLHRFDLRLSPREQSMRSLLKQAVDEESSWRTVACKACAVWTPWDEANDSLESVYVFAGGASESVGLFDLRMDGPKAQIVQRYRPRGLTSGMSHVSVSGLDVSKDKRELLVSYESDQIYTFPILQKRGCPAGPTMEDIDFTSVHHQCSAQHAVSELVSYGGHLNRFTFLKNAKYAGPNDEYICTGSDSGHAWIYERKSGTVVSLLGADRSTCNGAVPHPSLPFFVTYGIESTAKLWRASNPIDLNADDSAQGRQKCYLSRQHELSPITRMWDGVESMLRQFETDAYPDHIASGDEIAASGRFSSPTSKGISGPNTPRIGNALLVLPSILRQNLFECLHTSARDLDVPVEQPLIDFNHHVSLSRLKCQADRLGLRWNPWIPYNFDSTCCCDEQLHASDLVPDFPSDWLSYDERMNSNVLSPKYHFDFNSASEQNGELLGWMIPDFYDGKENEDGNNLTWLNDNTAKHGHIDSTESFEVKSRTILLETAQVCKEGGNVAMKDGQYQAAARRYDKAIQYVAVALMNYGGENEIGTLHLRAPYQKELTSSSTKKAKSRYLTWSDPLKLLLMCRMNLSLLFLKPSVALPDQATIQARAALRLLSPFCYKEGKIVVRSSGDSKTENIELEESVDTYKEAKALQAKAYFRLGSAALKTGDFAVAVKSFESSIAASKTTVAAKPDASTTRLLQEARNKYKAKKKRAREKYYRMLEQETASNVADRNGASSSPSAPSRQASAPPSVTPDSNSATR